MDVAPVDEYTWNGRIDVEDGTLFNGGGDPNGTGGPNGNGVLCGNGTGEFGINGPRLGSLKPSGTGCTPS